MVSHEMTRDMVVLLVCCGLLKKPLVRFSDVGKKAARPWGSDTRLMTRAQRVSASADALGLSREQRVDKPWVALAYDVQAVATVRSGHDADAGSPVRGAHDRDASAGRPLSRRAGPVSRLPNGCGAAVRVLGRSSMIAKHHGRGAVAAPRISMITVAASSWKLSASGSTIRAAASR